ncbi:hypothetical protein GCM10007079_36210 [Nocardiopsis terrae]|nr:hypothetical protein GCM10007079_36210 [Nocardiopsis terrae]
MPDVQDVEDTGDHGWALQWLRPLEPERAERLRHLVSPVRVRHLAPVSPNPRGART